MRNYLLATLAFFCIYTTINAQYYYDKKRDFQWISGINFQNHGNLPIKDGFTLDFTTLPPIVAYQSKPINFYLCNSNICNREGTLQFYSNGARIIGPNHEIMDNGAEIEWGTINEALSDDTGSPEQQGVLILPAFEKDSLYQMLYVAADLTGNDDGVNINRIYKAQIDMRKNNGLGKVIYKDSLLLSDSLSYGKITACRHANGRDWWILAPNRDANTYWRIMFSPKGLEVVDKQQFSNLPKFPIGGLGNAVFSPDGAKYAYINFAKANEPNDLYLFDFDRCSGLLSNLITIRNAQDSSNAPNVAFSPNSRYLYEAFGKYVYQYDTYASDIKASRQLVAVSDGYANILTARFMQMQLAPDNKIYISSRTAVHLLHRIDYPDRAGVACRVCQHCIDSLVASNWALPAYPHFRLGPLDGSPCDTLGLDNIPWARYRFAVEEAGGAGPLSVQFTDLTAFEPDTWYWDFGDPASPANSSSEQHPVHVFSAAGTYTVCLKSVNDYGADSTCQTVFLSGVSGIEPVVWEPDRAYYAVYPNPATDQLTIFAQNNFSMDTRAVLYNILGQSVGSGVISGGSSVLPITALPVGLYRLVIYQNTQVVHSQLVIKQ